jgi:hypothetical protein
MPSSHSLETAQLRLVRSGKDEIRPSSAAANKTFNSTTTKESIDSFHNRSLKATTRFNNKKLFALLIVRVGRAQRQQQQQP